MVYAKVKYDMNPSRAPVQFKLDPTGAASDRVAPNVRPTLDGFVMFPPSSFLSGNNWGLKLSLRSIRDTQLSVARASRASSLHHRLGLTRKPRTFC